MHITIILVHVSLNSKQRFSCAEDCKQFCYRSGDCFHGFPRAIFAVIGQNTPTLHSSNVQLQFGLNGPCQVQYVRVRLMSHAILYCVYKIMHVCFLYSACTWQGPIRLTAAMCLRNEELEYSGQWQWRLLWGTCESNLHSCNRIHVV